MDLNQFDMGVLIVIGLSALLSFFRGFVREIFSLGSWLGATVITLYMFQPASKWIAPHVGSAVVASGLASMGVFFLSLILLSLVSGLLMKFMKTGNEVGVLDNLLGLAFGVARGVLIVSIGYFVATIVMKEEDLPDYVQEAKTQEFVSKSAKWVGKMTPDYLDAIAKKDVHDDSLANDAADGIKKVTTQFGEPIDDDMPEGALPSMEDLQERIRQENERH